MKKTLVLVLAALMLLMSIGGAVAMTSGEYIGVGNGRNGAIVVNVTVSEDAIEAIDVISENETVNTGSVPVEAYPALMVENQSVAVDNVSGATISSFAMKMAVQDALTAAGADLNAFSVPVAFSAPVCEDTQADVVVIGAGGAGMTAAIKAAQAGSSVILLEKLDILGGTSNYSIEAFGAVGDATHVGLGCDIDAETLAGNLANSNPNGDPEAFKVLAANNGAAVNWLRSIGAEMTVAGGQTSVATSREVGELGVSIVSALKAECVKAGVDVRTASKATELVMTDGAISGVKVETDDGTYTIAAKAVVLATGGFAANSEMVAENYPLLAGYQASATVGATGDGHKMAEAVGAELKNLDYVRINFTYTSNDWGYNYYVGCLFNTGAILVNDEGVRFANDQGGYGVGPKVLSDQGGSGWGIFDNSIVESVAEVRKYKKLGLYVEADTVEELAEMIGMDPAVLRQTITTYQGYVANGKDEEFGRGMVNMTFDEAPYYACRVTCRAQGTFGGISTNTACEVLTAEGTAISGLYAAGECANEGTWGANPAAVNIVFGGIAGENAAAFAK